MTTLLARPLQAADAPALGQLLRPEACGLLLLGGVQVANLRAQRFYRKWGFVELGRFHWQGCDNIDMWRQP